MRTKNYTQYLNDDSISNINLSSIPSNISNFSKTDEKKEKHEDYVNVNFDAVNRFYDNNKWDNRNNLSTINPYEEEFEKQSIKDQANFEKITALIEEQNRQAKAFEKFEDKSDEVYSSIKNKIFAETARILSGSKDYNEYLESLPNSDNIFEEITGDENVDRLIDISGVDIDGATKEVVTEPIKEEILKVEEEIKVTTAPPPIVEPTPLVIQPMVEEIKKDIKDDILKVDLYEKFYIDFDFKSNEDKLEIPSKPFSSNNIFDVIKQEEKILNKVDPKSQPKISEPIKIKFSNPLFNDEENEYEEISNYRNTKPLENRSFDSKEPSKSIFDKNEDEKESSLNAAVKNKREKLFSSLKFNTNNKELNDYEQVTSLKESLKKVGS